MRRILALAAVALGACGDVNPGADGGAGGQGAGDGAVHVPVCGDRFREADEECDPPGPLCGPDCRLPFDPCDEAQVIDLEPTRDGYRTSVTGDTRGRGRRHTGSCGGASEQRVHRFRAPVRGRLIAETVRGETPFDSVVYVRSTCAEPGTELACNDDVVSGLLRFSQAAGPIVEAGSLASVFVDGYAGPDAGPYRLEVSVRPVLASGARCDPDRLRDECDEGLTCRATAPGPFGTCDRARSPSIAALAAVRTNADELRVVADGGDDDGDVHRVRIEVLDETGAPLTFEGVAGERDHAFARPSELPVDRLTRVRAVATLAGLRGLASTPTLQVRASLVDRAGLRSPDLVASLAPAAELGAGSPCEPAALTGRCAAGLVCAGAPPVCGTPRPPALSGARADRMPDGRLRFLVRGDDADGDVRLIEVTLLDPAGAPLAIVDESGDGVPESSTLRRGFDVELAGQTTFVGTRLYVDPAPGAIAGARLAVIDGAGLRSPAVEVQVAALPERAPGEACDPLGLDSRCQASYVCAAPSTGEPVCTPVEDAAHARCDAAPAVPASGVLEGETRLRAESVFDGTCAKEPGLPEQVFALSLDGRADVLAWSRARATAFDPVLYLQGGPDPCDGPTTRELACQDDDPGLRDRGAALVATALEPGRYILVLDGGTAQDGSGGAGRWALELVRRALVAVGAPCDPARLESRCDGGRCLLEGAAWVCR